MLGGTQLMVDFHMGDELVCFSISSLIKHLKDLLILILEDLILHHYLVVLSLQLIDFSLKRKLLLFILSLLRTRCKKGVILCVMASFAPHVGKGCLVKRECTNGGNQLNKAEESWNKCHSHRRRQMLMHKISGDFGITESVKFVTLARLIRSLVWISIQMDRDREANTRCTWFTQIGYVHGVEEFSLIVKGLHKYIGSSSPLVSTSE
ncbi:hypothetical protein COP2_023509 [Malus domestica]